MEVSFNKKYRIKNGEVLVTLGAIRKNGIGDNEWIELQFNEVTGKVHFIRMDMADVEVEEVDISGNQELKMDAAIHKNVDSLVASQSVLERAREIKERAERIEDSLVKAAGIDRTSTQAENAADAFVKTSDIADALADEMPDCSPELSNENSAEEYEQMDMSYFFTMDEE